MAQTPEEIEAQTRALLDDARQEDRRHLDDLLKQRDDLLKQTPTAKKPHATTF